MTPCLNHLRGAPSDQIDRWYWKVLTHVSSKPKYLFGVNSISLHTKELRVRACVGRQPCARSHVNASEKWLFRTFGAIDGGLKWATTYQSDSVLWLESDGTSPEPFAVCIARPEQSCSRFHLRGAITLRSECSHRQGPALPGMPPQFKFVPQ